MRSLRCGVLVGLLLVWLSCFGVVCGRDRLWDLEEDTTDWVDPHSMIDSDNRRKKASDASQEKNAETCTGGEKADCSIFTEQVEQCKGKVETLKRDLEKQKELYKKAETTAMKEQPFFEQYLRHIISIFENCKDNSDNGHYEVEVELSSLSFEYLSKYVSRQNVSIQEVHSILLKMMSNVRWVKDFGEVEMEPSYFWSNPTFLQCLNIIAVVLIILVASLQGVYLLRKADIAPSRFLFLLLFSVFVSCFLVSIPWTWFHLYKKKVAERMAINARGSDECANHVTSFWGTVASIFFFQKDECKEYFEKLEIDPLWEVPPTQAVAVTLTRFFLEPAGHIGKAFREFVVSVFQDLPVVLWFPVYGFIILFFFLFFFCCGRYRVATPFLQIEPAVPSSQAQIRALQDLNNELKERLAQRAIEPDGGGDNNRRLPLPSTTTNTAVQDVLRDDTPNAKGEIKVRGKKPVTEQTSLPTQQLRSDETVQQVTAKTTDPATGNQRVENDLPTDDRCSLQSNKTKVNPSASDLEVIYGKNDVETNGELDPHADAVQEIRRRSEKTK